MAAESVGATARRPSRGQRRARGAGCSALDDADGDEPGHRVSEASGRADPDYLIDGLKNCELPTVRFEYNEKNNPGKFTLGENYIYVVMPITIDT